MTDKDRTTQEQTGPEPGKQNPSEPNNQEIGPVRPWLISCLKAVIAIERLATALSSFTGRRPVVRPP